MTKPGASYIVLRLGSFPLGERPCLVAAFRDGVSSEAVAEALEAGLPALELRIDLFQDQEVSHVAALARRYAPTPAIATIRLAAEGGAWSRGEEAREALFRAVLPHVSAIDIETSALPGQATLTQAVHEAGKLVIGSFHDFHGTPSLEVLMDCAAAARQHGADIVKAACQCNVPEDLHTLTRFILDQAPQPVAVMAMGNAGLISRVFFPALGSLLTYTFLGEATAPGQLTYREMLRYLGDFYAECAKPA